MSSSVIPGGGRLALAVAPGTDHPAIRRRVPYDLVVANILAGPLITLAPDIASVTAPGGHAILAGLIARQMEPVLAAYRAQGEARIARWELLAQKLRVMLMPLSTQSEMIEQLREYLNAKRPGKPL